MLKCSESVAAATGKTKICKKGRLQKQFLAEFCAVLFTEMITTINSPRMKPLYVSSKVEMWGIKGEHKRLLHKVFDQPSGVRLVSLDSQGKPTFEGGNELKVFDPQTGAWKTPIPPVESWRNSPRASDPEIPKIESP